MDFVWSRGDRAVGVEVKADSRWRSEYGSPLKTLVDAGAVQAAYAVYTGESELRDGPVRVLPLARFLDALSSGAVLAPEEGNPK